MSSITFWNRLEPRPRSRSIARALAAEIRDPLWILTRQWQLGEFRGEDAASPKWVELSTRSLIDASWRAPGKAFNHGLLGVRAGGDQIPAMPIERALEEELPDGDDLSLAVELGQTFETLLHEHLGDRLDNALIGAIRAAFPVTLPTASPRVDDDTSRFVLVCGGRCVHGVALYRAAAAGAGAFWRRVTMLGPDRGDAALLERALADFVGHVRDLHGGLAGGEPSGWRRDGLRYDAAVSATAGDDRAEVRFRAHPGRDGEFDWYSFDSIEHPDTFSVRYQNRFLIPGNVRFRGMPNARWWDFESWRSDFGDIQSDQRDLGRLAVMEFMLVQGNDWFMIPFPMHVGTVCQVESLVVRDVFGGTTPIQRADSLVPGWSMFSTTRLGPDGLPQGYGNFFHLPASAALSAQFGPRVEEVKFFRDEMANLAWALEHTVPNAIGDPISYRDRSDQERRSRDSTNASALAPAPADNDDRPPARYVLQTDVPPYWYPLVPVRADDSGSGQIVLRLGTFAASDREIEAPDGRILNASQPPSTGSAEGLRLDEVEVPRTGVRVVRRRCVSRWIDGTLHTWTQRLCTVGTGEGSSGLRFDALTDGR